MTELTQFKVFFQSLVKPIINEAVTEAVTKALSSTAASPNPVDEYLDLKQAAELLNIAPQTIYQNIKRIPHSKRFGKLFFSRSSLLAYLEAGAVQTKKGGKQ